MEFSSAIRGDVAQSQVAKVRSINYKFKDGIKSLFIDKLEVEVVFNTTKETVVKYMQYHDVMAMDGGADAVTRFAPTTQAFT
jgi:hypothetical protein